MLLCASSGPVSSSNQPFFLFHVVLSITQFYYCYHYYCYFLWLLLSLSFFFIIQTFIFIIIITASNVTSRFTDVFSPTITYFLGFHYEYVIVSISNCIFILLPLSHYSVYGNHHWLFLLFFSMCFDLLLFPTSVTLMIIITATFSIISFINLLIVL